MFYELVASGKNSTDRGKMGTKRSVLTDESSFLWRLFFPEANTHDIKLLEDTLDHIVVLRPEPDEEHSQNLCLDASYTDGDEKLQSRGYTPRIRPCGEKKKGLERHPDFHVSLGR